MVKGHSGQLKETIFNKKILLIVIIIIIIIIKTRKYKTRKTSLRYFVLYNSSKVKRCLQNKIT